MFMCIISIAGSTLRKIQFRCQLIVSPGTFYVKESETFLAKFDVLSASRRKFVLVLFDIKIPTGIVSIYHRAESEQRTICYPNLVHYIHMQSRYSDGYDFTHRK
jgi:hypothetical protein